MDWRRFLTNHGIAFIEQGPNVAKGNINIRCPLCGSSDTSFHLGISLEGKGWGCWRNSTHRGRSAARLIHALIGCSMEEAHRLAGSKPEAALGPEEGFGDQLAQVLGLAASEAPKRSAKLGFMKDMFPISDDRKSLPFWNYLISEDRDYEDAEVLGLAHDYHLRAARMGPFANRIVIPIFMKEGLVNWTGRAIGQKAIPRYKTLTTKEDKARAEGTPPALRVITDCLWNYQELDRAHDETLVVVEGPFDAMRVDFFGREFGIRATCLFGKNMSRMQASLLGDLSDRFKRKIVLLDRDASLDAFSINDRVAHFGFKVHMMKTEKDPALFSPQQVRELRNLR